MTLEQAKAAAAFLGMALAVAGVVLDNRIIVWVAIGVLGVAMVLRFVAARAARPRDEESPAP